MRRFGITPRRSLGQHFVADSATVRRIADLSGAGPGDHVLEIGAGLGSLTLALVETGAAVTVVEIDERLCNALGHVLQSPTAPPEARAVNVVTGDARALDLAGELSAAEDWHLVANLPYNIATPLVLDTLRGLRAVQTMTVMVQREAAERLAAPPGSRARGIPSVIVELHAEAELVAEVPPSVFVPRPKVESAVVRIRRRRRAGPDVPVERFELLVRTAFGRRRKMLRRSLAGIITADDMEVAGVDPTCRPEALTLRQWHTLAAIAPSSLRSC